MDRLIGIPGIFVTQFMSMEKIMKRCKEARKLMELRELYMVGLREINEKVALGQIKEMKFEEIERIIEARFENTQLRGSMLISIKRSLLTRK